MDESAPPDPAGPSGRSGKASHTPPRSDPSPWQLVGLGVQFLVALLAGVVGGTWLDRRFGVDPWGMLAGLLLAGLVFVRLIRPYLGDDAGPPPPAPPAATS